MIQFNYNLNKRKAIVRKHCKCGFIFDQTQTYLEHVQPFGTDIVPISKMSKEAQTNQHMAQSDTVLAGRVTYV